MRANPAAEFISACQEAELGTGVRILRRTSFEHMNSSMAKSLEIVGDWWTLLIVRDCFMGVRRFDDFQEHLGIARNILASRMKRLVDAKILERRMYQVRPKRFEYVLTPSGNDLRIVLFAIKQWGDMHVYGGKDIPLKIAHKDCGNEISVNVICPACKEIISEESNSLDWVAGEGMDSEDMRIYSALRDNSYFSSHNS